MKKIVKKLLAALLMICFMIFNNYVYADLAVGPIYDGSDILGTGIIIIISAIVLVVGIAIAVSIRNGLKNKKQDEGIEEKYDGNNWFL